MPQRKRIPTAQEIEENLLEAADAAKKGPKTFGEACDRIDARMKAKEANPPAEDDDKPLMWRD